MKKSILTLSRLFLMSLLLASPAFYSCSSGTEAGDTNVEKSENKRRDDGEDKTDPTMDSEDGNSTKSEN
jgi:hypothetical protein